MLVKRKTSLSYSFVLELKTFRILYFQGQSSARLKFKVRTDFYFASSPAWRKSVTCAVMPEACNFVPLGSYKLLWLSAQVVNLRQGDARGLFYFITSNVLPPSHSNPFVEDYFPCSVEYDMCTILDNHIALGLGGSHGVTHVDVAASNEAV